jgi:hypothetical protein
VRLLLAIEACSMRFTTVSGAAERRLRGSIVKLRPMDGLGNARQEHGTAEDPRPFSLRASCRTVRIRVVPELEAL